ncbi:MAG: hypothetical protein IIU11_04175, partial [Bacteroidales bacterium]|nr:hypothetical protein [Bacteroidales bacterium]
MRIFVFIAVIIFAANSASAQTTSTINIGDTDYTLFTGFTTTDGNGAAYEELVDGNTSDYNYWSARKETNGHGDFNGGTNAPAYVEFNANAAFIPKGYILTCENEEDDYCKPKKWAVKAKLNIGDAWTTIHSTTATLGEGKTFQFRCSNDANNKYQYFRLEVYEVGSSNFVDLKEL